jgi:hypothetical protein
VLEPATPTARLCVLESDSTSLLPSVSEPIVVSASERSAQLALGSGTSGPDLARSGRDGLPVPADGSTDVGVGLGRLEVLSALGEPDALAEPRVRRQGASSRQDGPPPSCQKRLAVEWLFVGVGCCLGCLTFRQWVADEPPPLAPDTIWALIALQGKD